MVKGLRAVARIERGFVAEHEGIQVTVAPFEHVAAQEWNHRLLECAGSTYAQTTWAADFEQQAHRRTRAWCLEARVDDQAVASLVLLREFEYEALLDGNPAFQLIEPVADRVCRTYHWNFGPLFFDDRCAPAAMSAMLQAVERLARRERVLMVSQAQPAFHGCPQHLDALDAAYQRYGYERHTAATVLLRVNGQTSEALWQRVDPEARRKVRKARQQGVEVVEATTLEHVAAYYTIRQETAHRNGVTIPPLYYFQANFRCFPRDGYTIWLTRHEGRWVSGQGVGVFNGNLILGGVCYSDYAREHSIYGNDLMQWHLIEWAVTHGARCVDWVGYVPDPKSMAEQGINQFKLKWGGQVETYPLYRRVFFPWRMRFLESLRALALRWRERSS